MQTQNGIGLPQKYGARNQMASLAPSRRACRKVDNLTPTLASLLRLRISCFTTISLSLSWLASLVANLGDIVGSLMLGRYYKEKYWIAHHLSKNEAF